MVAVWKAASWAFPMHRDMHQGETVPAIEAFAPRNAFNACAVRRFLATDSETVAR